MQLLSGCLFFTLDINGTYQVFDAIAELETESYKLLY